MFVFVFVFVFMGVFMGVFVFVFVFEAFVIGSRMVFQWCVGGW